MSSMSEFLDSFTPGSTRVYKAGLETFLKFYKGETLDNFLDAVEEDLGKPRRQKKYVERNILKDFVKWMEEKNYAPKTIKAYVSAVQSFARYHGLTISTRYIDMPSSQPISEKYPWTLDKVTAFIEKIEDPEIKSIAVTILQSGLSISDILALTWDDIRLEFEAGITPLCLDLSRIKTDVPFMTFIGDWGVRLLRQHLQGKKLRLEDPLYSVSHRQIDLEFERLAKRWIGKYRVQNLEGKKGKKNPCRPHSLRAAFRTILSEPPEGMPYDVVEFMMGHELPEQVRVYNSRTRDGWRKVYQEYEHRLTPKGP